MANLITWELIQGETKNFRFVVKDESKNVIDVSEAVCTLIGKSSLGATTNLFEKNDTDFNHSNGATGTLTVVLNSNDLDFSGIAYCVLKIVITSGEDVDKYLFRLELQEAP
jgi:hypothetical protein